MSNTTPWFGTAFHRNTPWFNQSRDWVKYLQRCHYMLQQGEPSSDVAVYVGDFAPQMTGPANPVPDGYDYDYMGSDAILTSLNVVDGEWVVYDENDPTRISARWKVLAMPRGLKYIRPQVRQRLDQLKQADGRVVDGVPVSADTLSAARITPAVSATSLNLRWKERRLPDGRLFFLSNFSGTGTFTGTFRVTGKAPELFNPVSGEITRLARFESVAGGTRVSFDVKDRSDAFFLIFRDAPSAPSVTASSLPPSVLGLSFDEKDQLVAECARAGTYELTMSDGSSREVIIGENSREFVIAGPWQSTRQDKAGKSVLQATRFDLPAGFADGRQVTLDLGPVSVMAKVTLNGKTFDTLWMPPFRLDVTDALIAGTNQLQVLVTSTSSGTPAMGPEVKLTTRMQVPVSEEISRGHPVK